VDQERIAVGKALGLNLVTCVEWLDRYYTAKGTNLYESIQNTKPYADPIGGKAPSTLKFRYITEDVPYALVPISSLGDQLKVPTPTIDGIISLASALNGEDYWTKGNDVKKLGIKGMTAKQINKLVS
jgi:opine dehydrogenase